MAASSPRPRRIASGQCRATAQYGLIVLLAGVLISISSGYAFGADTAATQDTECPPGFTWSEDTAACVQHDTPAPLIDNNFPSFQATLPPDVDFQVTPTPTPSPQIEISPPVAATLPPDIELQVTPTSTPGTVESDLSTSTPKAEESPEVRPVSIWVEKYECSPGVDRDANALELWEVCASPASIAVTLTHGVVGGSETSQTTAGVAEWGDLATGHHYIHEDIPAGFGEPVVWCGIINAGEPSAPVSRFTVEFGNAIGAELLAGQRMQCYWFNFIGATAGTSTVTLDKHKCESAPPGFRSLEEWLAACPANAASVGFTLSGIGYSEFQETDASGSAMWTSVPEEGLFRLTEAPRSGYAEPVVWCESTSGEVGDGAVVMPPTIFPARAGAIEGEITAPGTDYRCYWFNIPDTTPDDGSTIIVQKHVCPERIEPGADYATVLASDCTERGDGIEFTLHSDFTSSTKTVTGGIAVWHDVPMGPFALAETTEPARYPDPEWYCFGRYVNESGDSVIEPIEGVPAPLGTLEGSIDHPNTTYTCYVYNYPFHDRIVRVHKWDCPTGVDAMALSLAELQVTCATPMSDVTFTLTDGAGSVTKTTVGGTASWYGVEPGALTLDEDIPPGYGEPIVGCSLDANDEAGIRLSEGATLVSSTDGAISREIPHFEFEWVCHYYNVSEGFAEITIRKWTCPPGYDVEAPGADPTVDCTIAANGVVFTNETTRASSISGDAGAGIANFGSLTPASYIIVETVPDGTASSFVWDCVGGDTPAVHPHPLAIGDSIIIRVAGGDDVICDWYNVPIPEGGSLTIEKYACWTETFVSEVDCERFEHGATFELIRLDDGTGLGSGTTDTGGAFTWTDLAEGAYRLTEIDHEPCHVVSDALDTEGNPYVEAGEDTIVKVYNCAPGAPGTPPGEPGTPPGEAGKPPAEWPNTGAAPLGQPPMISVQDTSPQAATPGTGSTEEPFFPIRCLDDAGAGSTGNDACRRGAIPVHILIDQADVDADIEVVEIVDGVMQAPTGPIVAAWYKETGRLGEPTNMVVAGHLNWWNVPEGVFYHLGELEPGDRIEVTGDDGATYIYDVQWVRQESALAPPPIDVVGPTSEPSLTLITCGGEWDSAAAEYTERTVVRAIQTDVIPAGSTNDA